MSGPASPADIVRAFYAEVWNRWSDDAVDRLLDPAITFRGSLGEEVAGRDGFRAYRDRVRAGSADFYNDVVDLVVGDGRAAARLRYSGHHTGTLLGIPATGRRFTYHGAAFFTIAAGTIHAVWVLGDLKGLADQLARP